MFLPRQRTRLEHRIICYCIYMQLCNYMVKNHNCMRTSNIINCLIWQFLTITVTIIVFFLSAMRIWSLLWAAPHRSAGMTMVCCMEEGHEFKLQEECQPVFCCLGLADCDLRSYLTWEGQVVKPLALSHSNPPNCLKAGCLSSQGVFWKWTVSGPQ